MKGLLIKEWYIIKTYGKSMLLIMIVFAIVTFFSKGSLFTFVPVFAATIPMTTLSIDERSKWNSFIDTLPFSRRKIVASKYISGILCVAVSALILFPAVCLKNNAIFALEQFVMQICFGSIYISMIMPATFRFGIEKARYINMITVAVVAGVVGAMSELGDSTLYIGHLWIPVIVLITALVLIVSEQISAALFSKKDM